MDGEFILCSAVSNGKDTFIGKRHHNCFEQMEKFGIKPPYDNENWEQGFLTSKLRFLDRRQAVYTAVIANQILDLGGLSKLRYVAEHRQLFSEDIFQ